MNEFSLLDLVPSVATVLGLIVAMFVVHLLLQRMTPEHNRRFRSQLVMTALINVGLLIVLLVIPISETMRGQLLGLIGIVVSAAIALSSTTFLGNAMAGIMLRSVRNFRTGDFVSCGGHFGRVTDRGLFLTEIQTETRDLTTLPNLFIVTHPLTTVRSSGTIVSCDCSLGYDVPRSRIETALVQAAEDCGLQEGFVHIMALGDFSVSYRVSGLLVEVKQLLSTRARLHACVLDRLHDAGIEIVSPNFMNQRVLSPDQKIIPRKARKKQVASEMTTTSPEKLVFDKADEAESLESLREERKALTEQVEALQSEAKSLEGAAAETAAQTVAELQDRLARLETLIEGRVTE